MYTRGCIAYLGGGGSGGGEGGGGSGGGDGGGGSGGGDGGGGSGGGDGGGGDGGGGLRRRKHNKDQVRRSVETNVA